MNRRLKVLLMILLESVIPILFLIYKYGLIQLGELLLRNYFIHSSKNWLKCLHRVSLFKNDLPNLRSF